MTQRLRLATLCALVALLAVCGVVGAGGRSAHEDLARPVALDTATLVVATARGECFEYTVELASDEAARRRGLMGRPALAPGAGMLFDFGAEQPIAMWMHNTAMPLDMLFANAAGVILEIISDTVPYSETLLMPRAASRYVLELLAGQAAAHDIAPGDRLYLKAAPESRRDPLRSRRGTAGPR